MRILVVEDEADLNLLLCKVLTKAGYTVDGCLDGEDAQAHLLGAAYDGILLDVMLPKKDGYTLVQELRDQGNDTPVLFLTARDSVADRVKGLDLGGDDYLVKPFDFAELLARIRAMTRKRVGQRTNRFTVGDLTLDTERRQAVRGGEEIPLLPKEFSILEYLVRNKEKVLSREQIEDQIWNYDYAGSSNNVDVYLSRLRKKIDGGREEKLIHTVRDDGIGIAPDQQARVWQRFYQVDPVRGEKSGAGLGLSMVWKIAQAHGGHMSLESVPGQGSSFTLHLPAER